MQVLIIFLFFLYEEFTFDFTFIFEWKKDLFLAL